VDTYRYLLISETNFFISALAVSLTSQNVNGLVIEVKFFTNPLIR